MSLTLTFTVLPNINIIKKLLWLGFKTAAQINTMQWKIQSKDFTGCCWKNEVKIPQTDKMRPPPLDKYGATKKKPLFPKGLLRILSFFLFSLNYKTWEKHIRFH